MKRRAWRLLICVNNWAWNRWPVATEIVTRIGLVAYLISRAIRATRHE